MNSALQLSTSDYLFMRYRSTTVKLDDVVKDYYPHLSKTRILFKPILPLLEWLAYFDGIIGKHIKMHKFQLSILQCF